MKSKLLLASLFALAVAPMASADVELRITGATAFRAAVHAGLKTGFFSGNFQFAHDKAATSFSSASKSLWKGPVTGQGTVTVRCTWSGSITGIHAVAVATTGSAADTTIPNVDFLTDANLTTAAAAGGGEAYSKTAVASQTAHMAFSDAYQGSTIYSSPTLTDEIAGIIPFIFVVNDTSATGANTLARYGFDNVTAQFARALMATGTQPKSLLTGNAADTRTIFGVGRDVGSGTRVVLLSETKYGVFTSLTQFQGTGVSDAITTMRVWPTGFYPNSTGNDPIAGNGGYTSGGTIGTLFGNKSDTSFALQDAAGGSLGTAPDGHLIAWVGTSDAAAAVTGGGAYLKYEGSSYTGAADDDKIKNGQYTAWSNEHIFYSSLTSTAGSSQTAIKDLLKTSIENNMGSAGVPYSLMNVFRGEEGGTVGP